MGSSSFTYVLGRLSGGVVDFYRYTDEGLLLMGLPYEQAGRYTNPIIMTVDALCIQRSGEDVVPCSCEIIECYLSHGIEPPVHYYSERDQEVLF